MQTSINQRIKEIVRFTEKSLNAVARDIGVSQASLHSCFSGQTKPSFDTLQKLVETYNINPNWLLMGEGEMLKNNCEYKLIKDIEHTKDIISNDIDKKFVYLYDVSSATGYSSFDEMIKREKIIGKYIIPDFKDVDWMIYVKGSGMYPQYSSGDIIVCRMLQESCFIQWGKVYVIATREQGILVKRLRQSELDNCIRAVSDNPSYDAFDIPKYEILDIAIVVGVVRLE